MAAEVLEYMEGMLHSCPDPRLDSLTDLKVRAFLGVGRRLAPLALHGDVPARFRASVLGALVNPQLGHLRNLTRSALSKFQHFIGDLTTTALGKGC